MGLLDVAQREVGQNKVDIWQGFAPTWYQREFIDSVAQFNTLIVGRRGGKSTVAVRKRLADAWDTGGFYQIIAPTWQHCYITVKKAVEALAANRDIIHRQHTTPGAYPYSIEFVNGGMIQWASADNIDSVAGHGPHGYTIDEFALPGVTRQEQLWDIVLPATMDYGASIDIITTPRGTGDLTYKLWLRGMEGWKGYRSWGYRANEPDLYGEKIPYDRGIPSYENPHLKTSPAELKAEMTTDYKYFEEILAVFQPLLDQALRVPESVWGTCQWKNAPELGVTYSAGVDIGKHADFTVVSVIDSNFDLVHMYRTQRDYKALKLWLAEILSYWNCLALQDTTGLGDPVYDEVVSIYPNLMPYNIFDNARKAALVTRLQMAFDHNLLKLPEVKGHEDTLGILKDEIRTFQMKKSPSGLYQYMAAERCHDDTVLSLALAWYLASEPLMVKGMRETSGAWPDEW